MKNVLVVKGENEKSQEEIAKFIDDSGSESLLTQDEIFLGQEISENWLIRLNESLTGSEIQKKSNSYYIRRVDNHLEIGYARIEFFR